VTRSVEEIRAPGAVPLWVHPEWRDRFSWLVQGTTGRGSSPAEFDLGLYGALPVGEVLGRWRALLESQGLPTAVHARQVHAADVVAWRDRLPPGLLLAGDYDGHLTARPGLMLSVSVADCVPIFLVEERSRTVSLLHAGWRGVAAGILERGVAALADLAGASPGDLWLHCGPSICGPCYEVGPEVHAGVRPHAPPPSAATPIDLRAAISERAEALGLQPGRVTASARCTRCDPDDFFSHRAGSPGRQMGILGARE
jgi:polyphenol oxidase